MEKDWHEQISQPGYEIKLEEDIWVPMRDGVEICVDIYRPDAEGKFPALISWSDYGKDQQKLPTNPIWQITDYIRGTGGHECGEQWFFVPRGYIQVIPDARGIGKSEGQSGTMTDGYDLIEWIAEQPYCNGNVGMIGMSAYAAAQYKIAALKPPHLKAIMPFEGLTDYYRHSLYHGGILNYWFSFNIGKIVPRNVKPAPGKPGGDDREIRERIKEIQNDPDIMCTPYLYLPTLAPSMSPPLFQAMLHPFDGPYYEEMSHYRLLDNIEIPAYSGGRWNSWAIHLCGAFDSYKGIAAPAKHKKMIIVPADNYGGMDRPFHEIQDVCLRWYDYWLKDNNTGLMDEPPITLFIQGINKWRYENEWPLAATQWTKFYLHEGGHLSLESPNPDEKSGVFTSNPWAIPTQGFCSADTINECDPVPKIIYETEPLKEGIEVTGPMALHWYAAIESKGIEARSWKGSAVSGIHRIEPITNDTNWHIKVKDIDVDDSERCVGEGWLKASHYELDEERSKPYWPFHPHTRCLPIEPGQVIYYASDVRMTSNVFLTGHRIRLEIAGQDQVQARWYHLPHMAEVTHTIYNNSEYSSYLLLPVIPKGYTGAGEPDFPPEGPFRYPKYLR